MRHTVAFTLLFLGVINLYAQTSNCSELKPISSKKSSFYYDFKKIRNGYALQIPLLQLKDELIDKSCYKYEKIRKIGRYSYLVPLLYIIAVSSNHSHNKSPLSKDESNFFTGLLFGAVAANLGCNMISNSVLSQRHR